MRHPTSRQEDPGAIACWEFVALSVGNSGPVGQNPAEPAGIGPIQGDSQVKIRHQASIDWVREGLVLLFRGFRGTVGEFFLTTERVYILCPIFRIPLGLR